MSQPGATLPLLERLPQDVGEEAHEDVSLHAIGALVKSDPLEFKEISAGDSIKFTTMTVTIYKAARGSLQVEPIPDEEFE